MRAFFVTSAWMILSLLVWSGAWGLLGFSIEYLINERQWRIPEPSVDFLNYGGVVGMVTIPTFVAVLGMRGKLPGIRTRRGGRGFPLS
jgi:hypothetical protein